MKLKNMFKVFRRGKKKEGPQAEAAEARPEEAPASGEERAAGKELKLEDRLGGPGRVLEAVPTDWVVEAPEEGPQEPEPRPEAGPEAAPDTPPEAAPEQADAWPEPEDGRGAGETPEAESGGAAASSGSVGEAAEEEETGKKGKKKKKKAKKRKKKKNDGETPDEEEGGGKKKPKLLLLILIPAVVVLAAVIVLVVWRPWASKEPEEDPGAHELIEGEERQGEETPPPEDGEETPPADGEEPSAEDGESAPKPPQSERQSGSQLMNTVEALDYFAALPPEGLGLEGESMDEYRFYSTGRSVKIDGAYCMEIMVYSENEAAGTNDVEGRYFLAKGATRKLYRMDEQNNVAIELPLP